jgi:hypothetical protein
MTAAPQRPAPAVGPRSSPDEGPARQGPRTPGCLCRVASAAPARGPASHVRSLIPAIGMSPKRKPAAWRTGDESDRRLAAPGACFWAWLSERAEVVGRITSDPANSPTEMGRRPQNGRIRHVDLPLGHVARICPTATGDCGSRPNWRCCLLTELSSTGQLASDRLAVGACKHPTVLLRFGYSTSLVRLPGRSSPHESGWRRANRNRFAYPTGSRGRSDTPGCRGAEQIDPGVRIAPVGAKTMRTRYVRSRPARPR